jgi:hypothetical protein
MKLTLFMVICIPLVYTDFRWPNAPNSPIEGNNEDDDNDDSDDDDQDGNNGNGGSNGNNSNNGNNDNSGNPNTFSYTPSRPVVRDSSTGIGWCFPLGICRRQNALTENSIIALESSLMYDLYLSSVANDCNNTTTGPCGTVYGYQAPLMTQNRTEGFVKEHVELQWEVLQKSVDYFCLKSVKYNAYLYISGQDCQQTGGLPQECGQVTLYKNVSECEETYGWDVTFILNFYVLRSIQFPDVYLFFNSTGCQMGRQVAMGCGKVVGHYFKNINDVIGSLMYQAAFWNIPYQQAPNRSSLLRRR